MEKYTMFMDPGTGELTGTWGPLRMNGKAALLDGKQTPQRMDFMCWENNTEVYCSQGDHREDTGSWTDPEQDTRFETTSKNEWSRIFRIGTVSLVSSGLFFFTLFFYREADTGYTDWEAAWHLPVRSRTTVAGVRDTAVARPKPSFPKGGEEVEPPTTTVLPSSHLLNGWLPSAKGCLVKVCTYAWRHRRFQGAQPATKPTNQPTN